MEECVGGHISCFSRGGFLMFEVVLWEFLWRCRCGKEDRVGEMDLCEVSLLG